MILKDRGDLDGAMALHKEHARLWRELGNPEGLSFSFANQAMLLGASPGRRREARRLVDEAPAIATRHGYQQLVPSSSASATPSRRAKNEESPHADRQPASPAGDDQGDRALG